MKSTRAVAASPAPARRVPQQARALHKVEVILEAAIRLIERSDIESLTTNALAKTAGISIGTLYQYFPDKEAVLAALIEREMADMSARILKSVEGPPPDTPGERIRVIVRAVLDAYGSRKRTHRMLLLHAMNRGSANRLTPLYGKLVGLFTTQGVGARGRAGKPLSPADAFVLTHAVAGVLRALVAADAPPPRDEVEDALVRCVIAFWPAQSAAPVDRPARSSGRS